MAPNAKVMNAFRAMKVLGISEETVKPVLKNLLRLYDRNWELIEEENYRVLADAIFDYEETKAAEEKKKKFESIDVCDLSLLLALVRVDDRKEEAQAHDEPERPLKRLRLRYQDDQISPSVGNCSSVLGETSLRRPKLNQAKPPQTCSMQEIPESSQLCFGDKRAEPESVSPRTRLVDKGKKPVSPQTCGEERSEPYQLCHRDRRPESNSLSPQIHLRGKGKESVSPQIAPSEKRSFSDRISRPVCFKEPKIEPGIVLLPKERRSNNHQYDGLIKPKHEPFTDDLPQFEVPIAMIHPALPDPLYKDASPIGNDSIGEEDGLESLPSQSAVAEDSGNEVSDSACKATTNCELVNIPEVSSAANFEIASSPLGEVKISLSCNSIVEQPHFRMPTLDAVLKRFEDKCLKSYRIIEPSLSAMKLMREFCDCVVEVGTDLNDGQQETPINITPALELFRKPDAQDVLGSRGNFHLPESSTNGYLSFQSSTELAVFLTSEGKGWGLRTLEDLPKGAFVCEYIGEILTHTELYERNMRSSVAEKHTYPVRLDADWDSEEVLKDEEALCLDATYYGNVARFINHRCFDANLVEIPVEVETPDHHYYHLAFFTTRKVDALEELTWAEKLGLHIPRRLTLHKNGISRLPNFFTQKTPVCNYPTSANQMTRSEDVVQLICQERILLVQGATSPNQNNLERKDYGIDFDDHDHPVKAFRCRCGSKSCRDMKRPSKHRAYISDPRQHQSGGRRTITPIPRFLRRAAIPPSSPNTEPTSLIQGNISPAAGAPSRLYHDFSGEPLFLHLLRSSLSFHRRRQQVPIIFPGVAVSSRVVLRFSSPFQVPVQPFVEGKRPIIITQVTRNYEDMNLKVAEEYKGFADLVCGLRVFVGQLKANSGSFDEYVQHIDVPALTLKLGFDLETLAMNFLVDAYAKDGLIDNARSVV
ncbi:hypothetical protein HHK36_026950 [Tetracentron sinense]|uniref:SET domain-containing protein n=1 Tax=Tetracentron sinense TaxID=13715 RepID=A0A834YGS8_TETSI|nr:hypothetical protein HHK36_026950 [Tetracentron sinense]